MLYIGMSYCTGIQLLKFTVASNLPLAVNWGSVLARRNGAVVSEKSSRDY